jgi:uncharacterized cupredoxin-like copper-binding protein
MSRQRKAMLLTASAIGIVAAACGGGGTPAATWTYGPTAAPVSTQVATPTAAPAASPSAATPMIALSEWKVGVPSTFSQGTYTFSISNQGTIPHELLVFKSDLAPSKYPTDAAGDIKEDGPGITLLSDGENIEPQGSQSRTVDLTPATYLFVCNIPGHFKAGMYMVVTVTP